MPQVEAPANISLPASSPRLDPSTFGAYDVTLLHTDKGLFVFRSMTVLHLSFTGVCVLLVMLVMTAV